MTADEVAAKTKSVKRDCQGTNKRMGMAVALESRTRELEAKGVETEASKKRKKKEEAKGEKGAAMKAARGQHLLK